jgi:hypothetical protein
MVFLVEFTVPPNPKLSTLKRTRTSSRYSHAQHDATWLNLHTAKCLGAVQRFLGFIPLFQLGIERVKALYNMAMFMLPNRTR